MMETDEEFTELVDGYFPRVDLVGKAANGVPRFLIAKGEAGSNGVIEAAIVRDLVKKATTPKEPAVTDVVEKAEDLDAGTPLAGEPEIGSQPGDAAWEALDAATAMKWTAILSRAKNALGLLAGREAEEALAQDGDGCEIYELEDANCAIDYAISVLAPYAVGEQAESDVLSDIEKAASGLSTEALDTLEGFSSVIKAGRVLSSQNEGRIREAVSSLQTVLSTLPQAPEPVAKEGEQLHTTPHFVSENQVNGEVHAPKNDGKGDEVNQEHERTPAQQEPDAGEGQVMELKSAEGGPVGNAAAEEEQRTDAGVAKADKSLVAVFNQSGKMIGVVDAEKIQAVDGGDSEDDAAPDTAELTPAPAAEVAPAPEGAVVAKSQDDVIKAAVDEQVKAVLTARDEEHSSVVKALEDRLAALEAPAPSRVLRNGALPPTHLLRGLDQEGTGQVDVAKAEEMRDRFESAPDAVTREAIANRMNADASEALQALHSRR